MKCENYELLIPEGKYKGGGYVVLNHKQQYVIKLVNNNLTRCSAEVCVDGKPIGEWIINGNSSIALERPLNDDGKFTFYKNGTKEFHNTLKDVQKSDRGLITVTFKQELIRFTWPIRPNWTIGSTPNTVGGCFNTFVDNTVYHSGIMGSSTVNLCSHNTNNKEEKASGFGFSSGGTGLSGKSDQTFYTVHFEANNATAVTMSIRLVGKQRRNQPTREEPRKLQPVTHNTYPMPV